MNAREAEEETSTNRGIAAPLISIMMLIVVVLGLSAYWWHIADLDTCSADHLKTSLGQLQGTAGTSYADVILTNTGAGRCTLSGFPAVFLTNSSGAILGSGAATNLTYAPEKLILSHGASVHASVAFPDAANFPAGSCSSASDELEVYPPGLTTSSQIPFTQYSCPGFSTTSLKVGS
jgi:hypothetical protein